MCRLFLKKTAVLYKIRLLSQKLLYPNSMFIYNGKRNEREIKGNFDKYYFHKYLLYITIVVEIHY